MTINLPNGFTVRPATLADVPACTALNNLYNKAIGDPVTYTESTLTAAWTTGEIDITRNSQLVHTADGQLVGFFAVVPHPDHVIVTTRGRIHPDFEGLGIATELMTWAEARAKEEIVKAPPDARIAIRANCNDVHESAKTFLTDWGLEIARYFWDMEIDFSEEISQPTLPAGIEFRPYNPDQHFHAVSSADHEAFKDHWGVPRESLESFQKYWAHMIAGNKYYDPTLWFVAWDGDEVAGICLCDTQSPADPEHGYVDTVAVRRPWRRRGLATLMLRHAFSELQKAGQEGGFVRGGCG